MVRTMPSDPIPWTERLRERSWPWLPVFGIGIVIFLLVIYLVPFKERSDRAECTRLYRQARTFADTLSVDARVPFNEVGKGGINCGNRRQLGALH